MQGETDMAKPNFRSKYRGAMPRDIHHQASPPAHGLTRAQGRTNVRGEAADMQVLWQLFASWVWNG